MHCPHCGGEHRLMEICPDAPGAWQLLTEWFEGARDPIHWLAAGGVTVLATLAVIGLVTALQG